MPRLTKRLVEQVEYQVLLRELDRKLLEQGKPPGRPGRDLFLWDDALPGFGLRITRSGVKTYLIQYRDAGRATRRVTIGRHGVLATEQARSQAQQLLAMVALGGNPAQVRADARRQEAEEPTVKDLAARYLSEWAEVRKGPKSLADDRQKLRDYVLPAMGGRKVASITRQDIAKLHHGLRHKPIQANRVLALLSKMFNLAEVWGWRPDGTNPCRHVGRYREEKRERYLSDRELDLLGRALREVEGSEHWAAVLALRLLLLTGARLGEILGLKWDAVDLERGVLRLPTSKTGPKVIVLGPPAVKLLSEAPRRKGNPYVCPAQYGPGPMADLKGPWTRLKRKVDEIQRREQAAGALGEKQRVDLSDLRLHDLRHSFASVGATAGLSLPMIGALLGHSVPATTARYAHLATDPLRQAAGIVSGHIAAVLEGRPEAEVRRIAAGTVEGGE